MASVVFGRKRLAIDISVKNKDNGWIIQPLSNHNKMTLAELSLCLRILNSLRNFLKHFCHYQANQYTLFLRI